MDTGFLDPAECYYLYGQPPPSPQKHSGYWADPRVWSLINRVAAGLPSANGSASGSQASVYPMELIQELLPPPELPPGELVVELTVNMDRASGAVQVPAAEKGNQIDYQARVLQDGDTAGE